MALTDPAEWAARAPMSAATVLRMAANGEGDPLPDDVVATVRRVLTERIGVGWRESTPARARVDAAAREFVAAVLAETAPEPPPGLRLFDPPVCGKGGHWCHGTCARHGRCMYAERPAVREEARLREVAARRLRDRTGAMILDCVRALRECGEDDARAVDWLRARSPCRG